MYNDVNVTDVNVPCSRKTADDIRMVAEMNLNDLEAHEKRNIIRQNGIANRNEINASEREERSEMIVYNLTDTPEYRRAKTVMIYKATKGEVRLEALERYNRENGNEKKFLYPLCVSSSEMTALCPRGDNAWITGYKGITEPDPAESEAYDAEKIDLVVCPCTAFDEQLNRTGMGAGFYDRFLENITADIVAVAFECQKTEDTYPSDRDIPMHAVITEKRVYRNEYIEKKKKS